MNFEAVIHVVDGNILLLSVHPLSRALGVRTPCKTSYSLMAKRKNANLKSCDWCTRLGRSSLPEVWRLICVRLPVVSPGAFHITARTILSQLQVRARRSGKSLPWRIARASSMASRTSQLRKAPSQSNALTWRDAASRQFSTAILAPSGLLSTRCATRWSKRRYRNART